MSHTCRRQKCPKSRSKLTHPPWTTTRKFVWCSVNFFHSCTRWPRETAENNNKQNRGGDNDAAQKNVHLVIKK